MTIITAKQAACILDVSKATVLNWVKHGYIVPAEDTKSKFRDSDVRALKKRIESGEIERLRRRANKRNSGNSFVPGEYLNDVGFISEIENIRNIFLNNQLNIEISLFVFVLKQLVLSGEVVLNDGIHPLKIDSYSGWKRTCVKKEIFSWAGKLEIDKELYTENYQKMYQALTDISHDDTVGIIYQSLLMEGNKSKQGAYYTPREIVDAIFNKYSGEEGKYLDPCCGTGQFLLGAIRSGYTNPELLYGYDIDGIAVRIARINLLLAFREKEFLPQIYKANTLTDIATGLHFCETNNLRNTFHLIATNPPWGSALKEKLSNRYSSLFPHITSGESFSLFLSKSIELSEKKGRISFVLPESILNIRTHSDIREYIIKNTTIKSINCMGRKFKGVFTPVIRLDLINDKAPEEWAIDVILENRKTYEIPQLRFKNNDSFVFDVSLSDDELKILSLLYEKPHVTLKGNAEWALGVVTGDNKKYVSEKKINGMEPVFKGSDIEKYRLKKPSSYIEFKPELFQQVAPEYKYRVPEKLIYKFISNKLIFAYDKDRSLTLNSANILLPKIEGYPIKIILAFLNSKFYQFIFIKKFNTHKVLRGDLEKLPFPVLKNENISTISLLVDKAIKGEDIQEELDLKLMKIIGLSIQQINTIMNFDKDN